MPSLEAKKRMLGLIKERSIIHATIDNKERISFILKDDGEEDFIGLREELPAVIMRYNPKFHSEKFGVDGTRWKQGISYATVTFSGDETKPTILWSSGVYNLEFRLDEKGESTGWQELAEPDNSGAKENPAELRRVQGCKNIDGEVYMFGLFRKLYKRIGKQQYQDLTYERTHPNLYSDIYQMRKKNKKLPSGLMMGFNAVDGFNKHDIYGCGDRGDFWHYNGQKWKTLDAPANFDMESIVCAADGNVYVAGALGNIIKGRYDSKTGKEHWKPIKTNISGTDTRINSLAWFKGKLYLGTDWALYSLDENEKFEKVIFPEGGFEQYSFANVASCDEALLSYGVKQALIFDGESWDEIVGSIVVADPY